MSLGAQRLWRLLGATIAVLLVLSLAGGPAPLAASLDFNAAWLEDWLTPFARQAAALRAGESLPVEGFLYPPSAAILLLPLAFLGPFAQALLGAVIQAVSFLSIVLLGPELWARNPASGRRTQLLFGLAPGLAVPLWHSAHWGQMGLPLAALVLLFLRSQRGLPALACAAGLKLYPLLALAPAWLRRGPRRSEIIWLGAVLVLLPALVLGGEALPFLETVLARIEAASAPGGAWHLSTNRQSLAALLERQLFLPEAWGRVVGLLLLVLVLFRARRESDARVAALLGLGAVPLLPGPCWPHHLAALPLVWFPAWLGGREARVLCLLSMLAASFPLHWALGGWPLAYDLGLPGLSALLALFALLKRTPEAPIASNA